MSRSRGVPAASAGAAVAEAAGGVVLEALEALEGPLEGAGAGSEATVFVVGLAGAAGGVPHAATVETNRRAVRVFIRG